MRWCVLLLFLFTVRDGFAVEGLYFEERVEPIFRNKCFQCHGADKVKRKGELDLRSVSRMLQGGDSGSALIPGKLENNLIWEKVVSGEMPPEKSSALTKEEILVIKDWIIGGARTRRVENHTDIEDQDRDFWSFQKLQKPTPPEIPNLPDSMTDLDRFLLADLQKKGLVFADVANRQTQVRRFYLSLTGLPPTPQQVQDFLNDSSSQACSNLMERLLASPQYGEHWGRHWLDVVGYSDSNGYHRYDTLRPLAYRYRDYVIKSFNQDKPYDQFWREQLAGDELVDISKTFHPDAIEKLTATHFLRNGPDGTDPNEGDPKTLTIQKYAVLEQQLQITISAMFGLTIDCARCHSHKFDPISQSEYYGLQSLFYPAFNVESWVKPKDRFTHAASAGELTAWEQEQSRLDQLAAKQNQQFQEWAKANSHQGIVVFEDTFDSAQLAGHWSNHAPGDVQPGGTPAVNLDSATAPGALADQGKLQIIESGGSGDRLLSTQQTFDWTPDKTGDWIQATFDLIADHVDASPPSARIGYLIAVTDFNDRQPNVSGNLLIDGHPAGPTAVIGDYPGSESQSLGTIGITGYQPGHRYGVRITNAGDAKYELQHVVDDIAEGKPLVLEANQLPDGGFGFEYCCGRSFIVDNFAVATNDPAEDPTVRKTKQEQYQAKRNELTAALKKIETQRTDKPGKIAWVTDISPTPPKVYLLKRGEYFQRGPEVTPTVLRVLSEPKETLQVQPPPFESAKTTGRRLAFARWATQPDSRTAALLARVQVNRIWMWYFGKGLVETPGNFGMQGLRPSHPQLLEWLACEFVESGWSTKHIHRLILNSHAFQQASITDFQAVEIDPQNHLLWSFPMRRLEAETIRDSIIFLSQKLSPQMYGEAIPYHKDQNGQIFPDQTLDGASDSKARRTIYLRHRRSEPISFLAAFDQAEVQPNCIQRANSTIISQSLVLLNGSFVVKSADLIATRIEHQVGTELDQQIQYAFELLYARSPNQPELRFSLDFLNSQMNRAQKTEGSQQQHNTAAAHRALTVFCQALLASNDFLYLQ